MADMTLTEYIRQYGDREVDIDALAKILKPSVWKPHGGERYFVLEATGDPDVFHWNEADSGAGDVFDRKHYALGNCFRTAEDAEFAAEVLKITAELRRASEVAGAIDWGNPYTRKWYIRYNKKRDEVSVGFVEEYRDSLQVYFPSEESAEAALESIGVDRIKKYLFGVT